jgi:hypothetical protein
VEVEVMDSQPLETTKMETVKREAVEEVEEEVEVVLVVKVCFPLLLSRIDFQ